MTGKTFPPITDAAIFAALEKRAAELLAAVQSLARSSPGVMRRYPTVVVQQAWEDFAHDWEAALDQFGANQELEP